VTIDGDTANIIFAGGDTHAKAGANRVEHFHRLRHHFRADSVARHDRNMI